MLSPAFGKKSGSRRWPGASSVGVWPADRLDGLRDGICGRGVTSAIPLGEADTNFLGAQYKQAVTVDRLIEGTTKGDPLEAARIAGVFGVTAVALGGKYSLSDSKLKEAGLTKYKRVGNGQYERTVGTGGPETLDRG